MRNNRFKNKRKVEPIYYKGKEIASVTHYFSPRYFRDFIGLTLGKFEDLRNKRNFKNNLKNITSWNNF